MKNILVTTTAIAVFGISMGAFAAENITRPLPTTSNMGYATNFADSNQSVAGTKFASVGTLPNQGVQNPLPSTSNMGYITEPGFLNNSYEQVDYFLTAKDLNRMTSTLPTASGAFLTLPRTSEMGYLNNNY